MNEDFPPQNATKFKFPDIPKPPEISGDIPVYQIPETKEIKEKRIADQLERWQNIETLTDEQMLEMFKDDGMFLIHSSDGSALRNGLLTATGIRKNRGDALTGPQSEVGHQTGIWFSLNSVFEGRSVLFLFHPGVIYSRFLHNQSIADTRDIEGYISVSGIGATDNVNHDLPLDYGVVLLPMTEQQNYEDFFERNGYRPSHVFYYEGGNGVEGFDAWKKDNAIPASSSNRFREVYHHKYWDIQYHQNGESVNLPDGGFKITKPAVDGFIAKEQLEEQGN